jgi:hypothetical protein
MLCFPQLSTGALAQYPIEKRRLTRTVINQVLSGARLKLADADAASVEWTLEYRALTTSERGSIEDLFRAVEGRLGEFLFLDPTDNLLQWSEQLEEAVWERNLLLGVTGSIEDPMGGAAASRLSNSGAASLSIEQTVNGPGWFRYGFSAQARSDQNTQLRLTRSTLTQTAASVFNVGPQWKPLLLSGNFGGTEESVRFGIEVGAGNSVDIYAVQVEAQPGASGYKKTFSRSGVYSRARFMDDSLLITADGPGRHSCLVRITARVQD